jgi:hypothetical protein
MLPDRPPLAGDRTETDRTHEARMRIRSLLLPLSALALCALSAVAARPTAAAEHPGPPIAIQRATAPISIDGDLTDAGWQGITPVTTWFETRVGDNVEPSVKNTGWVAYDDHYLYAAFRFEDPHPELIRAPIADHDQLSGLTDYGGIVLDSNDDGKSAVMFLANANGLMYDAVTNDASGEDDSPDFFWETAGHIDDHGWTLEIRVPFSSLRYSRLESPTWGVMLYRNYPRDRHYQFFSTRMPREKNCFVCNASPLTGLTGLPQSQHLTLAPYATVQRLDAAPGGPGTPMRNGPVEDEYGLDLKWSPSASIAIDGTLNPDFSQVEADEAQIGTNERFALFYPEKRSFFLEGKDLFASQLSVIHTRSINAPAGGGRVTGRLGRTSFTALGVRDDGGGLVTLPGSERSDYAFQDFRSDVGVLRVRHDLGASFLGLIGTGRAIDGGGGNAVVGPDLEWRPRPTDILAAQALWSDTRTPDRADLAPGVWDGRRLQDRALFANYNHTTRSADFYVQGQDIGPDFRADEGYMPQVGFRDAYLQTGYTVRPKDRFLSRIRVFTIDRYAEDHDGHPLRRLVSVGAGMDGRWSSFLQVKLEREDLKVGPHVFTRFRPYVTVQASPGRILNDFTLEAYLGDELDFMNAREGRGATLSATATARPNDHLELRGSGSTRWLDVDDDALGSGRLFLAQVERLRASWSFSSHAFVRLIGQYVETTRDLSLYPADVRPYLAHRESELSLSALLAYKLNWQTVFYAGYGDQRGFAPVTDRLEPSGRQVFAKVSYALQP